MAEPLGISQPIAPTGALDHRLPTGTPANAVTPRHDGAGGGAPQSAPSTEFHIGTLVEAVVRAPAAPGTPGALAVGTRLMLRIVAVPPAPTPHLLIGRVLDSGGPETLVVTPLGTLALQRRLALAPDTAIAFERLEEIAPEATLEDAPSKTSAWPALDEAIIVLNEAAPEIAAGLRTELAPISGPQLAGTLLFLLGAIYHSDWPAASVDAALTVAKQAKLAQRLADDVAALRRLGTDPATGEWRVLTLPLLLGTAVLPIRLYLRRRKPDAPAEDMVRFAIELELLPFGPLQLDALLRGAHLILVLRSHRSLPQELRDAASAVSRRALSTWGLGGDLSFAIAAEFTLTPLSNLRKHIKVSV